MTLSHGEDFVLDLTDNAMVADHLTSGKTTKLAFFEAAFLKYSAR